MAAHSSALAWRIPRAEGRGGPQSMGSPRVGHDSDWASAHTSTTGSVQFSGSVVSNSLRPRGPQHARPPRPSPTPRGYPNSCPSSRWCHPTIASSVVPFSSCPQSLPASVYLSTKWKEWKRVWWHHCFVLRVLMLELKGWCPDARGQSRRGQLDHWPLNAEWFSAQLFGWGYLFCCQKKGAEAS